ncbi:MAG TPA: MFS transporter [Terracidiphilus sp.]|nr:MFS transporter [Terracidiphilus sp.]
MPVEHGTRSTIFSSGSNDAGDPAVAESAQRKASWRLLPVIAVGYGLAYMDRVNISFASLRMNDDLHFSATVYGIGAGLFFIGYAFCEVPSNLLMLHFGPRRWLARIMLTWGLLAAAMMFVRTPWQFYALRLLLGIAEAGFFPGVVYYLTLWFPASMRARAVSRFYISLPLSSTVMGSIAGWLMGLGGKLGLAGWQWLFLVEGLPAALFSVVIFRMLPDSPADARWLTAEEQASLQQQLDADSVKAHLGHGAGVLRALVSPQVWLIGSYFFCALFCSYAFNFSAPAILQIATGWSIAQVGYLVASLGVAGAAAMIANAEHSDRSGERAFHCIIPCLVMGAAFLVAGSWHEAWVVILALGTSFVAFVSMLGPGVSVPTQFLAGRAAAAGIAAMNTITMFSGFAGPVWMGWVKDHTGSYDLGLRSLIIPSFAAAGLMYTLTRNLARSQPQQAAALAKEPA